MLEPEVRPMRALALAQLTELARLAPTAIGGVSNTHCGVYAEVLPSAPPPRPFRPFARVAPSSSSVRLSGLRRCPSQGKRLFRPSGRERRILRILPCLVHGTKLALKGGDPAAPSGTATLLRLHPPYRAYLRHRPPQGLGERLRVPPTRVV